MFDIDGGKLLILGVIALIVIKPKDLPGVMRQIGATIAQLRRMAGEFQGQFKDALREAELDDLKKDMAKMTDLDGLDPFSEVKNQIAKTKTEIESSLEANSIEHSFAESIEPPAPVVIEAPPAVHALEAAAADTGSVHAGPPEHSPSRSGAAS